MKHANMFIKRKTKQRIYVRIYSLPRETARYAVFEPIFERTLPGRTCSRECGHGKDHLISLSKTAYINKKKRGLAPEMPAAASCSLKGIPHPPIVTILYLRSSNHTFTSFSLHKQKKIQAQQKVIHFFKRKLQFTNFTFLTLWSTLCVFFFSRTSRFTVCLSGSCNLAGYSSCKISYETDISSNLQAISHTQCFKNS
jgi:hypothetical protein